MVYLKIKSDIKDLYFFINSPRIWVISGISIYDAILYV